MKKIFLSLIALVSTGIVLAQTPDQVAKFKSDVIDMGKLKQSSPATAVFTLTNIGSTPLIIETANPTCGCTIGDYTKSPITAGKNGEIKATYNAANLGAFEKHLTVKFAGVNEVKTITIKGEVLDADAYAKYKSGQGSPKSTKKEVKAKAKPAVASAS